MQSKCGTGHYSSIVDEIVQERQHGIGTGDIIVRQRAFQKDRQAVDSMTEDRSTKVCVDV